MFTSQYFTCTLIIFITCMFSYTHKHKSQLSYLRKYYLTNTKSIMTVVKNLIVWSNNYYRLLCISGIHILQYTTQQKIQLCFVLELYIHCSTLARVCTICDSDIIVYVYYIPVDFCERLLIC